MFLNKTIYLKLNNLFFYTSRVVTWCKNLPWLQIMEQHLSPSKVEVPVQTIASGSDSVGRSLTSLYTRHWLQKNGKSVNNSSLTPISVDKCSASFPLKSYTFHCIARHDLTIEVVSYGKSKAQQKANHGFSVVKSNREPLKW